MRRIGEVSVLLRSHPAALLNFFLRTVWSGDSRFVFRLSAKSLLPWVSGEVLGFDEKVVGEATTAYLGLVVGWSGCELE